LIFLHLIVFTWSHKESHTAKTLDYICYYFCTCIFFCLYNNEQNCLVRLAQFFLLSKNFINFCINLELNLLIFAWESMYIYSAIELNNFKMLEQLPLDNIVNFSYRKKKAQDWMPTNSILAYENNAQYSRCTVRKIPLWSRN